MANRTLVLRILTTALPLALVIAAGCKRNEKEPEPKTGSEFVADPINTHGEPPRLTFPTALRTDDETVNAFIDNLMDCCLKGEYGLYRLAVASEFDPLPRQHFERAWHAVKSVTIKQLMKVYPPEGKPLPTDPSVREWLRNPIYGVHATIELREKDGRPNKKPVREVVVLIVKENGEWKLGPPPPTPLRMKIMGVDMPSEAMVAETQEATTQPADSADGPDTSSQPATAPASQPAG